MPSILRDAGEDDGDIYVVGVRETTDPDAWSLLFMECLDAADEQEIDLGMDTYCLVVDPGHATCYGGVLDCEIDGARFTLSLTEGAAEILDMPGEAVFALDLEPQQIEMLKRGLTRVLTSGHADAIPPRLRA